MDSPTTILATQIVSISTAFLTSGAIVCLSYSSVPILVAADPKTSIPQTRDLFSSGSHIFPQLASVATSGFAYLAYHSPLGSNTQMQYAAAAIGTIGIAPFTFLLMAPTNFTIRGIKETDEGIKEAGGPERVRTLIRKFGRLNAVRGTIMAVGAGVGLWAALTG